MTSGPETAATTFLILRALGSFGFRAFRVFGLAFGVFEVLGVEPQPQAPQKRRLRV